MAKIPTTEFCPQCANETPEDILKRSGRIQNRVYQDLDTGKYECVVGHTVDLNGPEPAVEEVTHFHPDNDTSRAPIASADDTERLASASQTSVAVEEMPQSSQSQVIPGSAVMKQGGSMEMVLVIPEQYVGALQSYCDGIGKTVEEFVNEVVANGFENGWFV